MEQTVFDQHDHLSCINTTIASVEAECDAKKLQFTPVRRRVMEILLQEHRALGAYDILEKLRAEGLGSQPPVAYRALDFLVRNGFAHRVESLNAFVACGMPGVPHAPTFLICQQCSKVAEERGGSALRRIGKSAGSSGFQLETAVIEVSGLCSNCVPEQAKTAGNA